MGVMDRHPCLGCGNAAVVSTASEVWRVPGAHVDVCDLEVWGHLASFGLPWRRRAGCQVRCGVTLAGPP